MKKVFLGDKRLVPSRFKVMGLTAALNTHFSVFTSGFFKSRLHGCRWAFNDPLFWPKRVWILITVEIFIVSICVSGIIWAYAISTYRSSFEAEESSRRYALAQRRSGWIQHQQWLESRQQNKRDLLDIQTQLGAPSEPLLFISMRASSNNLFLSHISPVKTSDGVVYTISLEGSFSGLMSFLFEPMNEHDWQMKAGHIERSAENIDGKGQPELRMQVQFGWWNALPDDLKALSQPADEYEVSR